MNSSEQKRGFFSGAYVIHGHRVELRRQRATVTSPFDYYVNGQLVGVAAGGKAARAAALRHIKGQA